MKKTVISAAVATIFLSVFLSGCGADRSASGNVPESKAEPFTDVKPGQGAEPGQEAEPERETEPGQEAEVSALPYQFVRTYGIIKSDYPVYELDGVTQSAFPGKEQTASLTAAICQQQELIVNVVLEDYSKTEELAAGEGISDGDGLILTGAGIPEAGIKPEESMRAADPAYYEEYGHRRYIIEAKFELPSAPDGENSLSGYALRLRDFEEPLEFALKRVPAYESLEELAAKECGGIDTHDGISVISMGKKVKEGILVSWYLYSEEKRQMTVTYKTPSQETDFPVISGSQKEYPIKELRTNPYFDSMGYYWLSDVKQYGKRSMCLFDVPKEEQNALFQMNIPGITFLEQEESTPVTLPVPEEHQELNEEIPWKEGSVRILGISRMKEPQTVEIQDEQGNTKVRERPAVYIDIAAAHEDKDLALRRLICQRKLKGSGWEHERYDFDGKGNLCGFRVFYDEGDAEVTLKFENPAFYWNQPYEMELSVSN